MAVCRDDLCVHGFSQSPFTPNGNYLVTAAQSILVGTIHYAIDRSAQSNRFQRSAETLASNYYYLCTHCGTSLVRMQQNCSIAVHTRKIQRCKPSIECF